MTKSLRAGWILDGRGQAFAGQALSFREGAIESIATERTEGELDLGDALIVPGLVNAHVHLDLSFCPRQEPASFASWVRQVIAHRLTLTPEQTREAVEMGVKESLGFGVTMVGDISSGGSSWEALAKAGMRGTVYFECLGLSTVRVDGVLSRFEEWLTGHEPSGGLQPGISPHAPYSTASRIYRLAAVCGLPVATHVAESSEEMEFLTTGEGPLQALLIDLGIDPQLADIEGPLEIADHLKPARYLGLVHGNHWPHESGYKLSSGQGWIHCPRTHRFFGHKVHPFDAASFDPSQWSLGTDGRSSNPDLNLIAEAKEVHRLFPKIGAQQLLAMMTHQPAKVLGFGHYAGSLEPGKWADFLVFRPNRSQVLGDEPHAALLEGKWTLDEVWIGGERRIPAVP